MLYISAQPDEYYFLWQLELQIFNFNSLNINLNEVHILVGYNEDKKLSLDFKAFKKKHKNLKIYAYTDTRPKKGYSASLRPHILAKHFEQFPHLCDETFFYHDSDIVFSKLPDFELLAQGDTWYTSDVRSYLDSNYILKTAGEHLFHEMCKIVGIDPNMVKDNDHNAGGAQSLIKKPSIAFWKKLELDCENVHELLSAAEKKLNNKNLFNEKLFIQKWCTDMWVLWWNALLDKRQFEIHDELKFCWANSSISEWHATKILHYTGGPEANGLFFRKGDFMLHPPYHEQFIKIVQDSCSYPLVNMIKEFSQDHFVKKKDFTDVSFLIPIKIDSEDRLKNIYASTSYIAKFFKTNIIVMEVDSTQKIDPAYLPVDTKYIFKKSDNPRFFRTRVNNEMIKISTSKFIALYDADVIIPVKQIAQSIKILREGEYNIVSPYSGTFFNVDILLKEMFINFREDEFLEINKYKNALSCKRSYGGCIFLNRSCYVNAGMENEYLTSWGPDDIERVKRMQILGHKTYRVGGSLFHLYHERKTDSGYQNSYEYEILMLEYLNISAMEKQDLVKYIKNWTWTIN